MEDARIILSGLWISVMLVYLFGDVMRLYAGDFTPGEIDGKPLSRGMLIAMAIIMLPPIFMVFLSLTLDYAVNRWANIIIAAFYFSSILWVFVHIQVLMIDFC